MAGAMRTRKARIDSASEAVRVTTLSGEQIEWDIYPTILNGERVVMVARRFYPDARVSDVLYGRAEWIGMSDTMLTFREVGDGAQGTD
jgi:hypothetical protein